jgi:[acyl-carrier-protein] S-malonyltransferase
MKKAFVFPGQGSQHPGMAAELYNSNSRARELMEQANTILGFKLTDIMFNGTDEDLRRTDVTQPAIFLHSVSLYLSATASEKPDMVAGHSLGEFSALVAAGALDFADALKLVAERAAAMQEACKLSAGTMAAVLGMEDAKVEEICATTEGIVVAANYNCPGQLVISGELEAVKRACENLLAGGAKRALLLPVGGAFHSPLMEPARERLKNAIEKVAFKSPICAIYQNVRAKGETNPDVIRENLNLQLTAPVRWTQSVLAMVADGAGTFTEVGPGNVLQGLVKKISRESTIQAFGITENA